MTIPMLQGWGDEVNQLGQGVSNLINPNQQAQNALRQAALQNPDLIPQLGELERSNPGTLQKMGLGSGGLMQMLGKGSNFTDQIANTPESSRMKEDSAQKAANVSRTNAETANTQANTNLTNRTTPGIVKKVTAEGNVAEGTQGADIAAKNAQSTLLANKVKESNATTANLETALKKYPDLANVDLKDAAYKAFSGMPLDPALAQRIQSDPALASTFDAYTKGMAERGRFAVEMGVAELRTHASKSEQAIAFSQNIQLLKEARGQESNYQTILMKGKPDLVTTTMANSPGPQGDAAREQIKIYNEAHDSYQQVKEQVAKLTETANYLHDQVLGKIKTDANGGTVTPTPKQAPTIKAKGTTVPPPGGNVVSITPNAQNAIDAIKLAMSKGNSSALKDIQKGNNWKKLTPDEQRAVIAGVAGIP